MKTITAHPMHFQKGCVSGVYKNIKGVFIMKEEIIDMINEFKNDKKTFLCGILCGFGLVGFVYVLALIQYVYFFNN